MKCIFLPSVKSGESLLRLMQLIVRRTEYNKASPLLQVALQVHGYHIPSMQGSLGYWHYYVEHHPYDGPKALHSVVANERLVNAIA